MIYKVILEVCGISNLGNYSIYKIGQEGEVFGGNCISPGWFFQGGDCFSGVF